jgi:adenosine deaminase
MNTLLAITDNKDITLIQAIKLLERKSISIKRVAYIRTKSGEMDPSIRDYFVNQNMEVLTTPLTNEGQINSEEEYDFIEEEIMRWYIEVTNDSNEVYVFIGGGHKLHSLALQKSAFLLGAQDVFHMFVNAERGQEPKTETQIDNAIHQGTILYASLGRQTGWPAVKRLSQKNKNDFSIIKSLIQNLGSREITDINEYPFECISLLPSQAIQWLHQPLTENDKDWVLTLPKVDLHCHLGGFATSGALLQEVRNAADESYTLPAMLNLTYPPKWPLNDSPLSLDAYMNLGDNSGSYILKNKGCLIKQLDLIYDHFIAENIVYAEIRCSPFNYVTENTSGLEVLNTIMSTLNKKMLLASQENEVWCHVNIILIATRKMNNDKSLMQKHLQLAALSESASKKEGICKVVGVDLAGFESKETRAGLYNQEFNIIHREGVALTIHAGENDDSEGIWEAVFKLNTRRIGHGLNLWQDNKLLKSIANRNIGIEMCPFANYQIIGFSPMISSPLQYPLLDYLRAGVKVCVNTDNIGISSASLTDNFVLLTKMCPGITRIEILQLIRNGIEQSFIDLSLKKKLIKLANDLIFNNLTKN